MNPRTNAIAQTTKTFHSMKSRKVESTLPPVEHTDGEVSAGVDFTLYAVAKGFCSRREAKSLTFASGNGVQVRPLGLHGFAASEKQDG